MQSKAFCDCVNLRGVIFNEELISIDDEAFKGCTSLENIILPNSATLIGSKAFSGFMHLQKLYIPKNVKYLGESFINGTSDNLFITYGGSKESWIELTKTKEVVVSHPSHNDYHYYGDWTDKLIPTVTEEIVIIKEDARLTVFCEEVGTTLKYGK